MTPRHAVGTPDLWIVADEGDGVADAVAERARARDLAVSRVAFSQFARSVTVDFSGSAATVTPSAPVLLRTGWDSFGEDADAKFLRLETHAQVWAACTLCESPVINRPTEIGLTGYADHATALSLVRARARAVPGAVTPPEEIYSSGWLEEDGEWAVQDLVTYATAGAPHKPDGDGPYRYRRWQATSHYVTVTVVDGHGWVTDHLGGGEHDHLIVPSGAILGALALRFGAVIWSVPDGGEPEVAKVDAYPPTWALGQHLDAVADLLLTALVS